MADDPVLDFLMRNPDRLFTARQIYEELNHKINLNSVYRNLKRICHFPEVRRTKTGWYYSQESTKK